MSEERLIRAVDAQTLLDNKLFKTAFSDTRDKLIEQIECCDIKDDVMRDKLMLSLQLLKRLQGNIIEHVNTGKLIEKSLEKKTAFNRRGL